MGRGRKGHGFATSTGGVQVVEAPGAYSSAQTAKAKRPKPKRTLDDASDRADRDPTGKKRPRAPSWERDYQQIWKAVTDLGAEQFTGKEKKAYEARKIVERGGRAPVDPKMPYRMLMGLRKKAKQREEQRETMEAEAGVVTGNAGSARRKSAQTPRGHGGGGGRGGGRSRGSGGDRGGGSSSFGPAPSMGMMKSGVLHISRNTAPPGVRKRMSERDRMGGGRGSGGAGGGGARRGRGGGGRGKG